MNRQQTIVHSASVSGVGVHSGKPARLTVRPAGEGTGVVFVRSDVADRSAEIPALVTMVTTTNTTTENSNINTNILSPFD